LLVSQLADEFMLPRPPMPALLGYGVVMLGCVILEQFQVGTPRSAYALCVTVIHPDDLQRDVQMN
jgi:hypothetical protein